MISVSHLSRRFGSVLALDDVSFEVQKGEVVGFLGPNGAGKTTAMRILTGYLPATSGTAVVAGFDVARASLEVRRRIGYLPESVPLYREHRVREMLEFQARLHGLARADAARRIPAVLERVGLREKERDLVGSLSRGQRQRVGLAVALLPDPEVLILDEPTSGLDPLQRIEVRATVAELASDRTVLFSSHILPEIEAVCPRVVILDRGRIAADGTQAELVARFAGASHVRLEAAVGPDVATALRLLRSLPGVAEVSEGGRVGVHHAFEVRGEGDLREDVGALAASRGWALRELSWRRPTLEEIFARIALGLDRPEAAAPAPSAPRREPSPAQAATAVAGLATAAAAPAAPARKVVYNLNPFDQGATRDLGRPKAVDAPVELEAPRPRREPGGADQPGAAEAGGACERG